MAKQTVNIGTSENKGDGDPLRDAFIKINNNFEELYSNFNAISFDKDTKTFSGTLEGDLVGSVFSDTSMTILDGISGDLKYYPNLATNWNGTAPNTVGEALDRIAAAIKALNAVGP